MTDNISFDEHKLSPSSSGGPKGLVGFLINKLGVQDEATANIILTIVAIVIFAIAGFIFFKSM